ncbi:MAG: hypothetical protein M3Q30_13170 [Actinomycetota bacterium]|nr:hypothetical protein [Actinomycetota bacterium]
MPNAKESHGKATGHQAKVKHRKVCPPGQEKKGAAACTSQVATDDVGNALRFSEPKVYQLAGASGPVWAEFPADLNTVVAVGGTDLFLNADGTYSHEDAFSDGGSGCSGLVQARSFQTSNPNWSTTGCGTKRAISDVSIDYVDAWIYDSTPTGDGGNPVAGDWYLVQGTSLSAPIVAGIYGLAGNAWTVPYAAQIPYQHTASLHDIRTGSNGNCVSSIMCVAAAGYDGPTGVGTARGLGGF